VAVWASMWAATDIGPGKAPISDFMLISRADQDLRALSYNVLRYVHIALILRQCFFNPLYVQ